MAEIDGLDKKVLEAFRKLNLVCSKLIPAADRVVWDS